MCGFNGLTKSDTQILTEMSATTAHRGPDATGFWYSAGLSLAHNRLAVIDLSPMANQPMHSPDGRYVLVYNGEIYNYRELREELKASWKFATEGDTEVLLAGYARWGKDVFAKVYGIFACAIHDKESGSVLLARDHLGVKPLYYGVKDGVLYFSSELGGVIQGTGLRTLRTDSLTLYTLLNYVPSPYTMVEGIMKLRPGYMLRYENGLTTVERFFTPSTPRSTTRDVHQLYGVIDRSVERQLVSDRELGVFLSGGIDSSVVLHHAAKHISSVRTFSVDFEVPAQEKEKFNTDAELARMTAAHFGATHTTFTLSMPQVRAHLHEALAALDEPIANPTSVSQYLLAKWVREKGVVVALGGDGGDELFGGYTRHKIARAAHYYKKLPRALQSAIAGVYPRAGKLSRSFGAPLHMQLLALKQDKYNDLFVTPLRCAVASEFFSSRYEELKDLELSDIDAFMRIDRESWLADESLARTDRTSMAFGVEARVPLLDQELVAYADSITGLSKYSLFSSKKFLKDTYREKLPAYLFAQPKRGWLSPGSKWLRDHEVEQYVRGILSSEFYSGLSPVIDWSEVAAMCDRHIQGGGYHIYPLWNILQLQVWAEKYKITTT